jgi:hypothetical protein
MAPEFSLIIKLATLFRHCSMVIKQYLFIQDLKITTKLQHISEMNMVSKYVNSIWASY